MTLVQSWYSLTLFSRHNFYLTSPLSYRFFLAFSPNCWCKNYNLYVCNICIEREASLVAYTMYNSAYNFDERERERVSFQIFFSRKRGVFILMVCIYQMYYFTWTQCLPLGSGSIIKVICFDKLSLVYSYRNWHVLVLRFIFLF